MRKSKSLILGIIFLITVTLGYVLIKILPDNNLKIYYLDVGQGDATLFETPKRTKILIDGGPDKKITEKLGEQLSYFEKEIDIVIATHDDKDHIAGLIDVLKKYKVKVLITSLPSSKNIFMLEVMSIAREKKIEIIFVDREKKIVTDDGVIIKIFFPLTNMDGLLDGNEASIVTQVIYKDVKILGTGDLSKSGENFLATKYDEILESDILKLGHHGSDTSSSQIFLQTVKPKVAIVSAGHKNSFGHPHQSVIEILNKFAIPYLETSKEGTIIFETDGQDTWRKN